MIKTEAAKRPTFSKLRPGYGGSKEKDFPLNNAQLRAIVKNWLEKRSCLDYKQLINLLNSLYTRASSTSEKFLAGFLLEYLPGYRCQIDPLLLSGWLDHLTGWAQIDSLCQSKFSAAELLSNWPRWKIILKKLNRSKNISKRRASLVLLTRPVRESAEKKLAELAFLNISQLKSEKDILITKAVSWLLREMIKNHRASVISYLEQNELSLPKIALRETRRKLATGRKSGKNPNDSFPQKQPLVVFE